MAGVEVMAIMKYNGALTEIIEITEENRPRFEIVFEIFNEEPERLVRWARNVAATGKVTSNDTILKVYDGKVVRYQIW